ncbi:MAG: hypothetical protein KDC46_10555 [Thermoleophilia bacterium]|nr:hypothetical protein [Thermoleophilia bacterium]
MRVAAMEAPFVVELQSELDKLFAASDGGEPKPAGEYIHPKTVEFLKGEQIKALPYTRIKSALWAGIARQYADGKSKPPDQGMANDVEYIATYLPYVDAMFVDRRCWALATANPVAECIAEAGRAGQLFSVGNLDEFDAYLDAIEQSVSDEQRAYADLLYATPPSPSPVSK